jgi:hypothetical protein
MYFVANNTTNNDITLTTLLERIAIDLVALRLYYTGYIFNLIYTTILFRKPDKAALADSVIDFL